VEKVSAAIELLGGSCNFRNHYSKRHLRNWWLPCVSWSIMKSQPD
jgi:hypothetical protein